MITQERKKLILGLTTMSLAVVLAGWQWARTRAAERPQGGPLMGGPEGAGGRPDPKRLEEMQKRMAADLGLSDTQQKQFFAAQEKNMEKMRSVFENKSLSFEQKKAMLATTMQANQVQMDTLLTPEQKAKMASFRPPMPANGQRPDGGMGGMPPGGMMPMGGPPPGMNGNGGPPMMDGPGR